MAKKRTRGNGEGTIFQRTVRGKKVWVCEYTLGIDERGKRKCKTLYGKTRQEVKDKLNNLIIQIGTNQYVDKSNITMYSLGKSYIDEDYELHRFIAGTYIRKIETLNEINQHYIAQKPMQEINGYDVKDFYKFISNKFSNNVIRKICGLCNSIFKIAIKRNIVTYNFFDDQIEYKRPNSIKPNKKIIAFTVEEQKEFLDAILNKEPKCLYKLQFLISIFCGLRMGEVNALYLKDINLDSNYITITKTLTKDENNHTIMGKKTKTYAGTRTVYFNDDLKQILKEYINSNFTEKEINSKNDILLFEDKNKKYITTSQVNSAFKRLCQKYNISLGLNVNQHMLRHTFATRCIESGMSAKVLQKILGHTDITTTLNTYTDVFDDYEKKHNDMTYNYLKENNLSISNIKSVQ